MRIGQSFSESEDHTQLSLILARCGALSSVNLSMASPGEGNCSCRCLSTGGHSNNGGNSHSLSG